MVLGSEVLKDGDSLITLNVESPYETSRGRKGEHIKRRTSNAQHRTSNIDDATLYLFENKRITLKT